MVGRPTRSARRRAAHLLISLSLLLVAGTSAFGQDDNEEDNPTAPQALARSCWSSARRERANMASSSPHGPTSGVRLPIVQTHRSSRSVIPKQATRVIANNCKRQSKSSAEQQTSPLWIVLLGHGTFTRGVAKFNLRGPDVSAEELAEWLQPHTRPVVVVNCASASGPFVNRLSGKNRIVVTATKSGTEQNFARFGKYFAQAIAAPDSDLDHDDEVSVHEAFLRAAADVREFYEAESRIATEHALIDDNGDGRGTPSTMFRGTRPKRRPRMEPSWMENRPRESRCPPLTRDCRSPTPRTWRAS